jgi:hypothetical protein
MRKSGSERRGLLLSMQSDSGGTEEHFCTLVWASVLFPGEVECPHASALRPSAALFLCVMRASLLRVGSAGLSMPSNGLRSTTVGSALDAWYLFGTKGGAAGFNQNAESRSASGFLE